MNLTLLIHEIKRNKISLIVWSAALSFMLGVCVLIYPEMQTQMGDISQMFADMGAFSDAFGMDQLNFGEFMGYFGVECGNTLGIGGALLAGIVGITALSKEERDGTAEHLLTLPVTRARIITDKLLFSALHILIVNLSVVLVITLCILMIDVEANASELALILLAYFLMQIEIMAVTFGISAFLKKGGLGIGIGISFGLYFLSILANLSEDIEFIKYITPFGYADSGHIISEGGLEPISLVIGIILAIGGIALAYFKYSKKDIS